MRLAPVLAVATLAGVVVAAAPAAAAPKLELTSVTVKRTPPDGGFAGVVTIRVRLCLSVGPRAQLITTETRRVGSVTKAHGQQVEPLGVDLDKVSPYACVSNYMASWALQTRFAIGGGTYSVTIRARDGYGKLSAPIAFSVRPGS